eukprot:GFUD01125976.1.p1 GENE.GFUD01125976.1~~GFUD01125976.1.p1  ORF type:complete len:184 (-),score=45.00 GFUD01125976.1:20-571(-)
MSRIQFASFLTVLCCMSCVHSKLLKLDPEVILGHGYAIPPFIHRRGSAAAVVDQTVHRPRHTKVVKTISQFDEPGGWKPVQEQYKQKDFGHPREQQIVSGPPLGDVMLKRKDVKTETYNSPNAWQPYYEKTSDKYEKSDRTLQVEPELITADSIYSMLSMKNMFNYIVKSVLEFQQNNEEENI